MKKTFCTAIVLAAGSGKRMGTKIAKQYLEIDGKPLLYYTLLAFERSPQIDKIILTVGSEEQVSYCQETILRPYGFQKVASVITGGKERYDSVWRGLQAVKENLPKEAAEGIAAELGIDEVHAELLPQDKVSQVERLLKEENGKEKLAFVGDGINDAPVLTRADIGIAMGSMGSDAAIEAADVVLMDDDIRKIASIVRISRKTLGIVKQNIVFALAVKAIVLVLGAFGVANMWEAVFADVGVSVIAILNSMRALKTE